MSVTTKTGFELQGEASHLRPLLREVWASRSLIRILAKKDFFVRYRRASFGLLWAVALPLVQALVLAVIFSRFVRFDTGVKYAVFVFAGMLAWTFFSGVVSTGTTAIVDGSDLATKVYFPRAVLPLVTVWSGFRGFVPAVAVLIGFAAAFKAPLGTDLFLMLPAIALMLGLAAGFALVLAPLHVYFRDMRYIVQAILLPWFWGSGIIYPLKALGPLRRWIELNPAVGMIELFRASIGVPSHGLGRLVMISVIWVAALFVAALPLYRRFDRVFVDLL